MAFQRKQILGLDVIVDGIKSWASSTFSKTNHTHKIANITDFDAPTFFGSMPDFSRSVLMETGDHNYAATPGTIYKINVPGYFFCRSLYSGYSDAIDQFVKVAARPEYLFRHTGNSGNYGSYARPSYNTLRMKYGSSVVGDWCTQIFIPICPGIGTYMRWCDASSWSGIANLFVPCKGVPTTIKNNCFFTRVARGENHISTGTGNECALESGDGKAVFAGDWRDGFDTTNWSLKTQKDGSNGFYTFIGRYLMTGGWMNNGYFGVMDPVKRGTKCIYYYSGGTYILRYVTSDEVDVIIAGLGSIVDHANGTTVDGTNFTWRQLAKRMRNKWCILHYNWDAQTPQNKLVYCYRVSQEPDLDTPHSIGNNWLHGRGNAAGAIDTITAQPFA